MEELTFEVRADLSQYLAELQKGDRAMNVFIANVAMAPAALTRLITILGRGGKAVAVFSDLALKAVGFLSDIAQSAKGTAEFASSIDRVAKMAGVSAEALQEFRFAATQSGTDIETFDAALVGFGERLREARKGSGEFHDVLRELGVSFEGAEGRARATEDVILDYAEAVRKAQDPLKQNELAIAGFGTEGTVLVDLLARGRDGIAGFQKEARELGVVLNRRLIKEIKEVNAQFSKLQQVVDVNIARAVSAGLPKLGTGANDLAIGGPDLKVLSESLLPDDMVSSEALRGRIEERIATLQGQLVEKRAELERLVAASQRGRNARADAARAENIPALEVEIERLEIKLDLLSRIRSLETGAGGGVLGGADFDATGDSLLRLDESLGETAQGFAGLTEAAGRFEALGAPLAELLEATNGGFDRQAALLGILQKQVPELGQAMTGFFGETTAGAEDLDRAVAAVGKRFLDAFEGAILRGESLGPVLKGLARDLAELALQQVQSGGLNDLFDILGGLFGGGPILNAKGGAFAHGRALTAFARGGAFTNAIVDRPTLFPMAAGAGLMGEAGPEAVLPLTRLANGELGVKGQPGAAGSAPTPPPTQFFIDARGADREGLRHLTAAIR